MKDLLFECMDLLHRLEHIIRLSCKAVNEVKSTSLLKIYELRNKIEEELLEKPND